MATKPSNLNLVGSQLAEKFDVLRGNHFTLTIPSTPGIFTPTGDLIVLSTTKATLPEYDTEEVVLNYGNTQIKLAGKTTLGEFTATFRNFLSESLIDNLLAWKQKVFDPTTGIMGIASSYKIDGANLVEYKPDLATIVRTWKIDGLWISKLVLGEFDYEKSDERLVEVTFKADYAWKV